VVAAVALFSYSYLPTARIVRRAGPFGLLVVSNLVGGAVLVTSAALLLPADALSPPPGALAWAGAYAVAFYVVALCLFFVSFRHVKPWVTAALLSLETVAGLVLGVTVLGETVTPGQTVGAMVTLAAVGGLAYRNRALAAA
jgi:drug/metabolite transporter (DMT)-like permease